MQLQLYEKNPCVDYLNVILFVLDFYNTICTKISGATFLNFKKYREISDNMA